MEQFNNKLNNHLRFGAVIITIGAGLFLFGVVWLMFNCLS